MTLKPDWSKGYGRKGAALHAMNRFSEAISVYKKGLEVEPGSAALQSGLDEVIAAQTEARAEAERGSSAGGIPGCMFL